ncbi:MAG: HD domain-containing protein [Deltaproteobacteria bacterium]|jgi:3'-5' exoribonuclease|nr:HD domain-containing protein [Deltaproteobacteria bacterium]
MPKDSFVSDFKKLPAGSAVRSTFMVSDVIRATTKQGSEYLSLTLTDREGSIDGKIWDATPEHFALVTAGSILSFTGTIDSYKGNPQLKINSVNAERNFDLNDYLRASERPLEVMKTELMDLVETIRDQDFRFLVKATLKRPETEDFFTWPAAKSFHHAYLGGLLEHTLQVAKLADLVSNLYPKEINRDLLLAGAILHDIGKCWEFSALPATDYTLRGRLMGHLAMGAQFLESVAGAKSDFPQDKRLLLEHMLLSHHGSGDKGAVVSPKIVEAFVLHFLDDLDAKVNHYTNFINQQNAQNDWQIPGFDNLTATHLYKTPSWDQGAPPSPRDAKAAAPVSPKRPGQSQAARPGEITVNYRDCQPLDENGDPTKPPRLTPIPPASLSAAENFYSKSPEPLESPRPAGAQERPQSVPVDHSLDWLFDEGDGQSGSPPAPTSNEPIDKPSPFSPGQGSGEPQEYYDDEGPAEAQEYYDVDASAESDEYFDDEGPTEAEGYFDDEGPAEAQEYFDDDGPGEAQGYFADEGPADAKEYFDDEGPGDVGLAAQSDEGPPLEPEKPKDIYWSSPQYTLPEDDGPVGAPLNEDLADGPKKSSKSREGKPAKEKGQRSRAQKSEGAEEGEPKAKPKAKPKAGPKIDPKSRLF